MKGDDYFIRKHFCLVQNLGKNGFKSQRMDIEETSVYN